MRLLKYVYKTARVLINSYYLLTTECPSARHSYLYMCFSTQSSQPPSPPGRCLCGARTAEESCVCIASGLSSGWGSWGLGVERTQPLPKRREREDRAAFSTWLCYFKRLLTAIKANHSRSGRKCVNYSYGKMSLILRKGKGEEWRTNAFKLPTLSNSINI